MGWKRREKKWGYNYFWGCLVGWILREKISEALAFSLCTCQNVISLFSIFLLFHISNKKKTIAFSKGDQNNSSFEFKPIYEQSTQLVKCASSLSLD